MDRQTLLQFAIKGLESRRASLTQQIAELKGESGGLSETDNKPRRQISAAGLKAISDATKRRWARFHKEQNGSRPGLRAGRKLSPAQLKAMKKNAAKARAALAAKFRGR